MSISSFANPPKEAEIRSLEGLIISSIELKGLKRIEKEAVLGKLKSKKGTNLNRKRIREDIKALFAMGYFDDIDFSATPTGPKKTKLVISFKERPVIAELVFDGNERIDTDDLKEVVKVKEWSILDVNLVREDVDRIQKHYADKGFYLAKVDYDVQRNEDKEDEVILTFKINDYDKVKIRKILFLNNKVFSDGQLRKVFQETTEGSLFSFLSGAGNFRESAFKQDLQRLTYWYLDHGYVKFRYENPIVTVSDDKKYLYISIYVEEGEQYTMRDIDFSGDLMFSKEELNEDLVLESENTFRISQRNQDIEHLTNMYQDLGYAFVNVIPKMNIDDEKRMVDITYHFEKGNLVYFGEIKIVGNAKTHDKVIRRELRIHEGELYNGTNFKKSKARVERLGFFEPGEVIFNTITREGQEDIVDVEISVKERSTGTITLGAGYGSVQKFFVTTQISEINLLGRGQNLSFQAQYSTQDPRQRSFSLGFTDPYAFDTRWSMGGDIFSVQFVIPELYVMRRIGFNFRLGRPLTDDINAFITYKLEEMTVIENPKGIDTEPDEGILSSIIWSVVRDKRNNRFETTGGDYQRVSLETAGVGGKKRFLKWNVNNRFYTNFLGDFVFKNSTEYGQISRFQGNEIPRSERFLLGGPSNMKGFDILSLGPDQILDNGQSAPLGGLVQMFSLFELEHPLIREAGIKWLLFFDVGNSFEAFPGTAKPNGVTQDFTLREDAGFGIRWFSPIGPLRFEWGFPLDKRKGERSPVFFFFIGPPF